MSLQTRLGAFITAVGADIKALQARTPTILSRRTVISETEEPTGAVEWRVGGPGGALIAKLVGVNPIEDSVIVNRSELRLRVKSRDGTQTQERLLLDSDGKSDLFTGTWLSPSTVNGWQANLAGAGTDVKYRKEGDIVRFKGIMDGRSATSSIAFNLPTGYRPAGNRSMTHHYWNGSSWLSGRIRVQTNGDVYFLNSGDGSAQGNYDQLMDGLSFPL